MMEQGKSRGYDKTQKNFSHNVSECQAVYAKIVKAHCGEHSMDKPGIDEMLAML